MSRPDDIVAFWRDAGPDQWFAKSDAFDADFRDRFRADHLAAARREHDDWIADPTGALALCLLLDQWPRNCFRGTGHAFATDPLARMFARQAIAAGHDQTSTRRYALSSTCRSSIPRIWPTRSRP